MDTKFHNLAHFIKEHESYWSKYALHLSDRYKRELMTSFYRQYWDPYYQRWMEVSQSGLAINDAEQASLADIFAPGLSDIRDVARRLKIPVPELKLPQATISGGFFSSLRSILKSKQTKQAAEFAAPFIPGGTAMLGTLSKLDEIVSDAKDGNPVAVETVKAIKAQSDVGDPVATQAVATMAVISKVQNVKARNERSLYSRGISVGHDPITFGASRDHRGGRGGGGGVSVTRGGSRTPTSWSQGRNPAGWQGTATVAVNRPRAVPVSTGPAAPRPSSVPTTDPAGNPYTDPYAQQPQQPYDPYGGYGYPPPYPYPQTPYPYPQTPYPSYDPYGMYGLPGLPPGYGYEEPIIDKGGFQQYDPATDSFYSSNQKQVYDEATGMFMPVIEQNPYGNPYGF